MRKKNKSWSIEWRWESGEDKTSATCIDWPAAPGYGNFSGKWLSPKGRPWSSAASNLLIGVCLYTFRRPFNSHSHLTRARPSLSPRENHSGVVQSAYGEPNQVHEEGMLSQTLAQSRGPHLLLADDPITFLWGRLESSGAQASWSIRTRTQAIMQELHGDAYRHASSSRPRQPIYDD